MPRIATALVALLSLAASVANAAGSVEVSYKEPEKFTDPANDRREIDANLRQLTSHFEALGQRYLADGQKLNIEVLDIDMAGSMRPLIRRAGQDIRVIKGQADWPRIELRYTLESPGRAPRSGQANIADMAYLQHLGGYAGDSALRYEKRMLDQWFSAQFGAAALK